MNWDGVAGRTGADREEPRAARTPPCAVSVLATDVDKPWTSIQPRRFAMHKHDILLRYDEFNFFTPNAVTRLLAKIIRVQPGDVVLDLGSGVGPLAIWAALEPSAEVHAVELLPEHCEFLRENLLLNGVAQKVSVHEASLFEALPQGFQADVIVADVSGISEDAGRLMGWYPPRVPTGGPDGTSVIIPLLMQARHYLRPGGRMYFPVGIGMADGEKIMNTARSCFEHIEVLTQADFPLSPVQYAEVVRHLPERITKHIRRRGTRYAACGLFCEAMNPVLSPPSPALDRSAADCDAETIKYAID